MLDKIRSPHCQDFGEDVKRDLLKNKEKEHKAEDL